MTSPANIPNYSQRTLDDFKAQLRGGGARPNLFECQIAFPDGVGVTVGEEFRFNIKAASLPASTVNPIIIPFRGRQLKISGDRTYDPWTITVLNDTDFKIRTSFEKWLNFVNRSDDNAGVINPSAYMIDMSVYQLGRGVYGGTGLPGRTESMPVHKTYKFKGVFPSEVSPIELSYDATDQIETYTVQLQYQWFDMDDGGNNVSIVNGSNLS